MKKLTYADVVAAALQAFKDERLQAQHRPQDRLKWSGCYYRIGPGALDEGPVKWNGEPLVCAVGAALDQEQYEYLHNAGLLGDGVPTTGTFIDEEAYQDWLALFASAEDMAQAARLQHAHDEWAQGNDDGAKFRQLIGATT